MKLDQRLDLPWDYSEWTDGQVIDLTAEPEDEIEAARRQLIAMFGRS